MFLDQHQWKSRWLVIGFRDKGDGNGTRWKCTRKGDLFQQWKTPNGESHALLPLLLFTIHYIIKSLFVYQKPKLVYTKIMTFCSSKTKRLFLFFICSIKSVYTLISMYSFVWLFNFCPYNCILFTKLRFYLG